MAQDELKRPLLIVALVCVILVALVEVGSVFFAREVAGSATASNLASPRPGYAISYLAAIDALLLYSLALMTISLVVSRELTGRTQGILGLVISLLALLGFIAMIVFAFGLLMLMVSLLLSPIFGTIAYFVAFADFGRDAAAIALSLILVLKIVMAACLVLAQPRFLQNKSLVVLVLLSLGCTLLIAFLHAFPPGFLVSITDVIAALVIAIVALIWAIFLLVGSLVAVVKAVV